MASLFLLEPLEVYALVVPLGSFVADPAMETGRESERRAVGTSVQPTLHIAAGEDRCRNSALFQGALVALHAWQLVGLGVKQSPEPAAQVAAIDRAFLVS
jgi:hypothetical protein